MNENGKSTGFARGARAALVAALLVLQTGQAAAHPHAAIDLRSALVFDDRGRIAALRIDWTFDEFYTAFAVNTLRKGDEAAFRKSLDGLAQRNLTSLAEYDYFVDLRADGARQKFGTVKEYETGMIGNNLWLRFVAPLAKPIDPRATPTTFAVYDPTYYIEILYEQGARVAVEGAAGAGCGARIVAPDLNAEAKSFAGGFGPNENIDAGAGALFSGRPGTSLGELFAEIAVVECAPR